MAKSAGVMTRKVQVVNAREYRKVAIVERYSEREHKPNCIKPPSEEHIPLSVLARRQYYMDIARAKAAIARGGWR